MARRDAVVDAIWDVLARHEPKDVRWYGGGQPWVRCTCQPAEAGLMDMADWHRHVAEQAADAAAKLDH